MRIIIKKSDFLNALHRCQGIIERKTTHFVLSYLSLQTYGGASLRISATDYDVSYISYIPCNIEEKGSAAVNGKNLYDIVKLLPEESIKINLMENKWLEINCGKSNFKIPGIAPEDYPKISDPQKPKWIELPKDMILYFFDKTSFCMCEEEARPYLNGVYFKFYEGEDNFLGSLMVATDGKRLSSVRKNIKVEGSELYGTKGIIHRRGVTEVKKFLDCEDKTVLVSVDPANITLMTEENKAFMVIKQIEGEFPDWERVIPEEIKLNVIVNKKEISDAIRRASLMTSKSDYMIKLKFMENQLKISCGSAEEGEAVDYVDIDFKGEEKEIAYNYQYILQAIDTLEEEKITFRIKDEDSATIIKSLQRDDILQLVMPMRM